jgi:hypothetical protein
LGGQGAALNALSHGLSVGLVVCGIAALAAAGVTALWLRESDDRTEPVAAVVAATV